MGKIQGGVRQANYLFSTKCSMSLITSLPLELIITTFDLLRIFAVTFVIFSYLQYVTICH